MVRILIVEDQPHNIRLIEQIIDDIDDTFDITKATNGTIALAFAQKQQFDLILMDIALPDLDGIEVTNQLRKDPKFIGTPIIAVTAYAMQQDKKLLQQVFTDYVAKPIDEEKLTEVIKRWVVISNESPQSFNRR